MSARSRCRTLRPKIDRPPQGLRAGAIAGLITLILGSVGVGCASTPLSDPVHGVHRVRRDDTVYSIARRYDVTVGELIAANDMTDPNTIMVGQTLLIPGRGPTADDPPVTATQAESISSPPPSACRTAERSTEARRGLLWPVETEIEKTRTRTKLARTIIVVPARIPVWAAANGRVSFAGKHSQYGQLVAIRHSGLQVATLYTGSFDVCVRPGARVEQGQVIAVVHKRPRRRTGLITFEVRPGHKKVPTARAQARSTVRRPVRPAAVAPPPPAPPPAPSSLLPRRRRTWR